MITNDVFDFSETINSILKVNNSVQNKPLSNQGSSKQTTTLPQICDFEKKLNVAIGMMDFETIDLTCDDEEPKTLPVVTPSTSTLQTNVLQPMLSIHNDHQYGCNHNQYLENGHRSHESDHEAYSLNLEPEVILQVEGESSQNSALHNKSLQQFSSPVITKINNNYNSILRYNSKPKALEFKKNNQNLPNLNGLRSINKSKFIVKKTGMPVKNDTVINSPNYTVRKTGKKIETKKKSASKDDVEVINLSSDENEQSCSESVTNSENDWRKDSEHECDSEFVNINNSNDQNKGRDLILKNSIFDVSKPPKVILELISHWVLQSDTNVILQKLNLKNKFLKGFYQCLRAICTLSLTYKSFTSKRDIVEIGITTLQIHVRDDKKHIIDIFGAYNSTKKLVRYYVLPKTNRKSIVNVIEAWIEKSCTIFVDEKINLVPLKVAGYNVFSEKVNAFKNVHVKNNLERKLLAVFQGKIHQMSSSIIQQFLDELAWRNEFGNSSDELLKSIIDCIQFQTRQCANKNFISFLNKVAESPQEFLIQPNYRVQEKQTKKRKEDDRNSFTGLKSSISPSTSSTSSKTNHKKNADKKKLQTVKQLLLKEKAYQPIQTRSVTLNSFENCKSMERIYFGYKFGRRNDAFTKTIQNFTCKKCKKIFSNNIDFLDHVNGSVFNVHDVNEILICKYCLQRFLEASDLKHHIDTQHPLAIVNFEENTFSCPICEMTYSTMQDIRAHLNEIHPPYDLPYKCNVCSFLCYSHRLAIDHFYLEHKGLCLIQCPLCLLCVSFHKDNSPYYLSETQSYIDHINSHIKQKQFKCKKCVLTFSTKDKHKKHLESDHIQNENDVVQFNNFQNYVIQNLLCFECHNSLFLNAGHLKIMSTCEKCDYTTYCQKAFAIHTCTENYSLELDRGMICICGFKSIDGFELAKHLVNCNYKTIYRSISDAEFMKSNGSFLINLGLKMR